MYALNVFGVNGEIFSEIGGKCKCRSFIMESSSASGVVTSTAEQRDEVKP